MIEAKGLKRTYKTKKAEIEAVRGVDLLVRRGEIVGFLGPNGAGKTTTLKMLCTLLAPTDGNGMVAGCDLRSDSEGVRRRIGYVSQSGSTLGEALAGNEIVDHARLYGIDTRTAIARGKALLSALDLDGIWERKCNALSGGQRRRLDIVMGLINEPMLVFLDEPSTGLDPQSRANLWGHIRRLRDEMGTTVFITTHYMDEADQLCDRILVMDHGEIVAEGTQAELKKRISGDAVSFTVADTGRLEEASALAAAMEGADPPITEGGTVNLHVPDGGSALPKLLRDLDRAGIEIIGVEVKKPTLDDVFLTLTGRSLRETA
ncbi:ATP-binding cassette domain-containing protein [Pelagibacterium lacus]|uniref:ATP-binding cassette domain-containing protein n=2 Tax=Pelagibacterium lacus TaxID=2282655 RepID=A0A369WEV2_9HYPH|nr:ATP-binding cassette domain-containing protein [Pelagibacterium lacus]